VSLVECHATGTILGDAIEVGSMARVFAGSADVPIGSAKSNVGHLITAAGGAGLLKVLAAMEAGVRPPTLGAEKELPGLAGTRMSTVDVDLAGLRFPPRDMEQALAQQLLALAAARDAIGDRVLPRDRTMVLVGMGCDPEVNRYGARWRAGTWLDGPDLDRLSGWRDAFGPALTSAGVLGTMPNLVANRLNAQFDLAGPSFTVSAEEASGLVALE